MTNKDSNVTTFALDIAVIKVGGYAYMAIARLGGMQIPGPSASTAVDAVRAMLTKVVNNDPDASLALVLAANGDTYKTITDVFGARELDSGDE